jgi:hypothetical protein
MKPFYTFMAFATLVLAAGSGIAVAQAFRLNEQVHQCQRAHAACEVRVVPVEVGNG